MTDEQIAELFLEHGFIWPKRRERTVAIRVSEITEGEAIGLKSRFDGGSVNQWHPTGHWQWTAQGKSAFECLGAIGQWVTLQPVRRVSADQLEPARSD